MLPVSTVTRTLELEIMFMLQQKAHVITMQQLSVLYTVLRLFFVILIYMFQCFKHLMFNNIRC